MVMLVVYLMDSFFLCELVPRQRVGLRREGRVPTTSFAARWLSVPPHTLHPTPYTLHPTPDTLHPAPYTLHPAPYTLHPAPYTLHPAPPHVPRQISVSLKNAAPPPPPATSLCPPPHSWLYVPPSASPQLWLIVCPFQLFGRPNCKHGLEWNQPASHPRQ